MQTLLMSRNWRAVTPRSGRFDGELDCQWSVIAPPGQVIRLQLTQIDMQDGAGCGDDYLEVHNSRKRRFTT